MLLNATMMISASSLMSMIVDMSIGNPVLNRLECIEIAAVDLVNHLLAMIEEDSEE